MKKLLLALLLTGCTVYRTQPVQFEYLKARPEPVWRDAALVAYYNVTMCMYAINVNIPFDSVKKEIVPGPSFNYVFRGKLFEGNLGLADLDSVKILIAEPYRDNIKLWMHEWVHILAPAPNHDSPHFVRCGV